MIAGTILYTSGNISNPFIRTAHAEINRLDLMGIESDLSSIVNILDANNAEYAILHCNSTYPAPHHELNLNIIPIMKERYNCIVGYSGHENGVSIAACSIFFGGSIYSGLNY